MKIFKYQVEEELKKMNSSTNDKKMVDYVLRETSSSNVIVRVENTKYYCTHCKKWHVDKQMKLKQLKKCPYCKRYFMLIGKRNVVNNFEGYITDVSLNKRKELIIRVYYFSKHYDKKSFSFGTETVEIERINYDHQVYMNGNTYSNMSYLKHKITDNVFKRDRAKLYRYYSTDRVITTGIKEMLKFTKYKYHCLDIVAHKHIDLLDYLEEYERNPKLELLLKNGNYKLVSDIAYNHHTLNLKSVKPYLDNDVSYSELNIAIEYNTKDYLLIRRLNKAKAHNNLKWIKENKLEVNRLARYLVRQKTELSDYKDYFMAAKKLGVTFNKKIKYPSNFVKAHDEALENLNVLELSINDAKIEKYAEELEKYKFSKKGLLIRPALSQKELVKESKELHHCVRTYANKYANQSTAIFLIRQEKNEDTPLVTLELKDGRVVQCRAKNNHIPTDQVINFVDLWCKNNNFVSCFN